MFEQVTHCMRTVFWLAGWLPACLPAACRCQSPHLHVVLRVLLQVDGQVGAHHALLTADLVEGAGHHGARTLLGQVMLHLLPRRHRLARLARQSHQRAGGQVGL